MMKIWGMTDIGLVRRENQDAYAVRVSEDTGYTICVVCDGMGGPGGGRLASTMAVETFLEACQGNLRSGLEAQEVRQVADFAIAAANRAVYERSKTEPGLRGMGTTLVSVIAWEGQALVSNVGDSRAYLIRPEEGISRVTRDHSLVERLVEMGNITEEQARCHPDRNLITRALGPEEGALSDSYHLHMAAGDYLLLCTDGLVETATDQEMEAEVLRGGDPNGCLDRLLALAKRRGAADNVTAVLLQQL